LSVKLSLLAWWCCCSLEAVSVEREREREREREWERERVEREVDLHRAPEVQHAPFLGPPWEPRHIPTAGS